MANLIKYSAFIAILSFSISFARAQQVRQQVMLLDGYGGMPSIKDQKYVAIKGDPYFLEDWAEAVIYAANGNQYVQVLLKYDLVSEELHFHVPEIDQSYQLDMAVDSFTFVGQGRDKHFVKQADGKFYERLVNGADHRLYKRINKNITVSRPYNSADKVHRVVENTHYFFEREGQMEQIQLSRRSVLQLVDEQQRSRLEMFIKENAVKLSNEQGVILAFEYLNK